MTQRIALLHATPVAMAPVHRAFEQRWPEALLVNLLDDSLTTDRAKEKALSASLCDRFVKFGHYAYASGASAILVTCSAFGPAIELLAEQLPVPVLKPNEAMFAEALNAGKRIGMLVTFAPAVVTMEAEFADYARQQNSDATLKTLVVEDAIDLLRRGNAHQHNQLVADRAPELADCDVIMLAHFSTSGALTAVQEKVSTPVLTAPHAAVQALKQRISG